MDSELFTAKDRLSLFTVEEYQETDKKKKIKEKLT
jgi:hypothetical protein